MARIIECGALPIDEKVYLTNSKLFGYRVVHPIKKKDGSINWKNLLIGSTGNLFMLLMYLLITMVIWYGVNDLVSQYKDVAENPCNYCRLSRNYVFSPQAMALTMNGGINFTEMINETSTKPV